MWAAPHSHQARAPRTRKDPNSATAARRPMVGEAAGVPVAERLGSRSTLQAGSDDLRRISAALLGRGCEPRNRSAPPARRCRSIADREDRGMRCHRKVGRHHDAARLVGRRPEPGARRRCRDACGPQDRPRLDPQAVDDDASGIDVLDLPPGPDLDAQTGQFRRGIGGERLREGRQDARPGLDDDHPGGRRIDFAELARQTVPGEFGDGTGQFHAGRPTTHDDEAHEGGPLGGIDRILGPLEGDQQAMADVGRVLEPLQARRVGRPVVAAEVAVLRARREDEVIVGQAAVVEEQLGRGRG